MFSGNFCNRQRIDRHQIFVIEKNERELGQAFGLLLLEQEGVEAFDGCSRQLSMEPERSRTKAISE